MKWLIFCIVSILFSAPIKAIGADSNPVTTQALALPQLGAHFSLTPYINLLRTWGQGMAWLMASVSGAVIGNITIPQNPTDAFIASLGLDHFKITGRSGAGYRIAATRNYAEATSPLTISIFPLSDGTASSIGSLEIALDTEWPTLTITRAVITSKEHDTEGLRRQILAHLFTHTMPFTRFRISLRDSDILPELYRHSKLYKPGPYHDLISKIKTMNEEERATTLQLAFAESALAKTFASLGINTLLDCHLTVEGEEAFVETTVYPPPLANEMALHAVINAFTMRLGYAPPAIFIKEIITLLDLFKVEDIFAFIGKHQKHIATLKSRGTSKLAESPEFHVNELLAYVDNQNPIARLFSKMSILPETPPELTKALNETTLRAQPSAAQMFWLSGLVRRGIPPQDLVAGLLSGQWTKSDAILNKSWTQAASNLFKSFGRSINLEAKWGAFHRHILTPHQGRIRQEPHLLIRLMGAYGGRKLFGYDPILHKVLYRLVFEEDVLVEASKDFIGRLDPDTIRGYLISLNPLLTEEHLKLFGRAHDYLRQLNQAA